MEVMGVLGGWLLRGVKGCVRGKFLPHCCPDSTPTATTNGEKGSESISNAERSKRKGGGSSVELRGVEMKTLTRRGY